MKKESLSRPMKAFTMIELLLALTLFAMVASVIYASLSSGIQTWKRGEVEGNFMQRVRVAMQKFYSDLASVVVFHEIEFVGNAQELYFAGVVSVEEPAGVWNSQVAKIRYSQQRKEKELGLYRSVLTISESYREVEGEFTAKPKEVLYPLKETAFQYAVPRADELDPEGTVKISWEDSWKGSYGIPPGVRMIFTFENEADRRDITLVKTVFLPTGRKDAVFDETEGAVEEIPFF